LVVELNIRMDLVVFAKPLLIHGIREGSTRSVQGRLTERRESESEQDTQERNTADHAMVPPY
jgi:hypothetical protein